MYLKPLAPPAGDVGVFDRAGFWLNLSPAGFKIMDLTAGGAAAASGLKVGDEITAVDGVAAARSTCRSCASACATSRPARR